MRMKHTSAASSQASGRGTFRMISAFTLIELLAVIAIIGILAAFLLVVTGGVNRTKDISRTTAEMGQIEAALESYKTAYGTYPPGGNNVLTNALYYELVGTTNNNGTFHDTGRRGGWLSARLWHEWLHQLQPARFGRGKFRASQGLPAGSKGHPGFGHHQQQPATVHE